MPVRSLVDIPAPDRVEAMRSWFQVGDVPSELRVKHDRGFNGYLGASRIGTLAVTDMMLTGADGSLHRRVKPMSTEPDLLLVNVTESGKTAVLQNGQSAPLIPGRIGLTSTRFDLAGWQWQAAHRYAVIIPYRQLALPDTMVDPLVATQLRVSDALLATVSSFVLRMAKQASSGDGAVIAPLATTLVEMVRAVLAAAADDPARASAPLRETVFPRVMEYLRIHVFDQGLCAASIASANGVSVRYLYLILEREGVSLGDWVRERRAQEAARLLTETELPIATIAYRVGYADQAHFSRSFRRWHAMTPRDWRRLQRA